MRIVKYLAIFSMLASLTPMENNNGPQAHNPEHSTKNVGLTIRNSEQSHDRNHFIEVEIRGGPSGNEVLFRTEFPADACPHSLDIPEGETSISASNLIVRLKENGRIISDQPYSVAFSLENLISLEINLAGNQARIEPILGAHH